MLDRICPFLRAMMRSPDSALNSIADELALARQYLDIMQSRFESKLEYSIRCDPEAESMLIPTLLLQPLIENAIKYGQDPLSGQIRVAVEVRARDEALGITVRDHGRGPSGGNDGQGITNTRRRLAVRYGAGRGVQPKRASRRGSHSELEISS